MKNFLVFFTVPFSRRFFVLPLESRSIGISPSTRQAIVIFINFTMLFNTINLPRSPFSAPNTALKIGLVTRLVNNISF
ncbi:ORF1236 [White spot syndrome virus]|uniref:ORF1236 n=1 Tax=White spot syndrome virus TaxID=342409 RepID=A0A2D3I693_9VIRU|nr:ORF1236 [White spot syndrome virus]